MAKQVQNKKTKIDKKKLALRITLITLSVLMLGGAISTIILSIF